MSEASASTPSDQSLPTVIFVDDERDMRKLVSFMLQRRGYRVLTAGDGQEGLELVKNEHPDVILLDVMMPKMNGQEVLKYLKSDDTTKDIPVIMLSALGASKDVAVSQQLGAFCHLEKPYQAEVLVQTIQKAIAHRSSPEGSSPTPTQ